MPDLQPEWIRRYWAYPVALIVIIPTAVSFAFAGIAALQLSLYPALGVLLGTIFATVAYWLWLRRMPKREKHKVGFAVAINSESTARPAVRQDFIDGLRKAIKNGPSSDTFDFIVIPDHFSSKAQDIKDAETIRRKSNSNFVLLGRVKSRVIQGQEHDVLNIVALVSHSPTSKEISTTFAREFSELLPGEHRIQASESYLLLEFTTAWAAIVAKYIIGIASAISGDWDYAETLFREVQATVSARDTGFLIYTKLKERVPRHLAAIAEARADVARAQWLHSDDGRDLDTFLAAHREIRDCQPSETPSYWSREAIYRFLADRDVKGAFAAINRIPRRNRDATWYLSVAFLSAYSGNLKKAVQSYRKAADLGVPVADLDVTVGQVEPFICSILTAEPDKTQLHLCLGFINWLLKGDLDQATRDLNAFIFSEPKEEFLAEKDLARQWLAEINRSR